MIKNIIFDFDGVILDSVPVKTEAFRMLFEDYDIDLIEKLIQYHELNGGISRYVKIKYFFTELLKSDISQEQILEYANEYSQLTKIELINSKYIIDETLSFIKENFQQYNMYIASGADENDLTYICNQQGISDYFHSISGSPKEKSQIVKEIIEKNSYQLDETILIGDSINDYEAASKNGITFYGYNNISLKEKDLYIKSFDTINF